MILEIEKRNDQYIIVDPPYFDVDNFYIKIDTNDIIKINQRKQDEFKDDVGYQKLKEIAEKLPHDEFIQNKLKYYVPYKNIDGKSDDEVYHEYLMERYGK